MDYRAAKKFILQKLRNELSDKLYYHGLHHTLDVLLVAKQLCDSEGILGNEKKLVQTAALFHDCGFVKNIHNGHEAEGCKIARQYLPEFAYSLPEIDTICSMIMATKIPQTPNNLLEKIICDADLDYLGRPDFYTIGRTLYHELGAYHLIDDEKTWNRLQVSFLSNHQFFTKTNKEHRESVKIKYLMELKDLVNSY